VLLFENVGVQAVSKQITLELNKRRESLHEVVADEHSVWAIDAVDKLIDPFLPLLILSLKDSLKALTYEFAICAFDLDVKFIASAPTNKHAIGLVPLHEDTANMPHQIEQRMKCRGSFEQHLPESLHDILWQCVQ
jgi:hypothetical protein